MNTIIIGFSRPKAWLRPFSWVIRLVTWAPYSHTYIRYDNAYTDRSIVFQASGLVVNFMGQTMFDTEEDIYAEFSVPVSAATKLLVIQNATDKVGSPYGVGQIVGFGWVLFMRIFGKKVNNPFASTSSFVCSELVADLLNEMNGSTLDSSTMTPKDIYNYVLSKGFSPVTDG
jgi:hypothetical protein